jgi:hypothetical protein
VLVDVLFEVNQLQRHTFELPAGYYPSPKRILKCLDSMVGLGNKYPKQLLNSAVHKVLFSDSTVKL